ncbi:autotransporter [plant metagenome]
MPFPRPAPGRLSATPFALSALFAAISALMGSPVEAACAQDGTTVTCSGPADPGQPNFSSTANGLFITVEGSGVLASPVSGGNSALRASGTGLTLVNSGVIDPQALAAQSAPHQGVSMGNGAGSTQIVFNQGKIFGTYSGEQSLDGLALMVQNGAAGRTIIENATGGEITAKPTSGLPNALPSDALAVAAFGGAQVTLTNRGTITGRVSLSGTGGNTFNNLGTVVGSVHLGAGGGNTFVASTDSSLSIDGGAATATQLLSGGQTLDFARTGVVDGGGGGNRLNLIQGFASVGTIAVDRYLNFSTMNIEGGTWSLSGNASATSTTLFTGATVRIATADSLTAGTVTSRGATIESSTVNTTMPFNRELVLESGMTTFGAGDISMLNSGITGTGALRKTGSGMLFLSRENFYSGGTYLRNSSISVSHAQALGTGGLTVDDGVSNLRVASGLVLPSNITLNSGVTFSLVNDGSYELSGALYGAGSLRKQGTGTATLSGVGSYTGGTTILNGTLALRDAGTLSPQGGVALSSATSIFAIDGAAGNRTVGGLTGVAGSRVQLGANTLIFGTDSGTQRFDGGFSGTGGIIKQGASTAQLGGVSSHTGATAIFGGTLALTGSGALAETAPVSLVGGGSTFDLSGADGARRIGILTGESGTRVQLGTGLFTFGGAVPESYTGVISGDGSIAIAGSVRLGGVNTYQGSTSVLIGGHLTTDTSGALGSGLLDVASGATLDLMGTIQEVANLAGEGAIAGVGRLLLGSDNASASYAGTIAGTGELVKRGTGRLTLGGSTINSAARVSVEAGELRVSGRHNASIEVNDTASLSGAGHVGSATVLAGGRLYAGGGDGLQIAGNLTLNAGSRYVYTLGAPSLARQDLNSSVRPGVGGNVVLDGLLDLNDPGGQAGIGYYRLLSYNGSRSGTGLQAGNYAASLTGRPVYVVYDLAGHVDLRIDPTGSDQLQTWRGGNGSWGSTSQNWSNEGSALPASWAGNHAVFNAAGGNQVSLTDTLSFAGLQFVSDGNRLSGGALQTVASGSEIRVLDGATATIDTPISGAGGIEKTEGGTLILSGANTYGGQTVLSGGVLAIDRRENLGGLGTRLQFNGGTLRILGTGLPTLTAGIDWSANGGGFDIVEAGHTFLLDQQLSGGDLYKSGAGTLRITGNQRYRDTYVTAGTLIGDTGSIRGNLHNAGTVAFEQVGSDTFAGAITGTGTLVKRGLGRLTLGGPSAGRWDVQEGSLAADATQYAGDTAIGPLGTLQLHNAAPAVYADVFSGSGLFAKTGQASLTLTGDSSGFTGTTDIKEGILIVGAGGTGVLGGSLNVEAGATLAGSGTVGTTTILAGARVAPGNSIGTLTVNGDLTFSPGSVYEVEADPDSGASDRIDVTGRATLAGSVLHVGPDGGFGTRRTYTILTANTRAGEFDSVSSDFAFLDPTLSYTPQTVTLALERKVVPVDPPAPPPPGTDPTRPITFADLARSGNQRAVALALETLPAGHSLHEFVLTLPNGAPSAVFNSLSGEAHAGVSGSLAQGAAQTRNLPLARLRGNLNAGLRAGSPTAAAGMSDLAPSASALPASAAQPAWAEIIGNWRTQDGDGNAASVREHTGGVFVGADHEIGAGWRIGGAFGYTDSKIKVRDRASQSDVSSYSALVYGGRSFEAGPGAWNLMLGGGYTWHDISTRRNTLSQAAALTADYGASTVQLFTELGYRWRVTENATLEPFAGVAWSDLRTRSFSESGGTAALSGQSASNTQTTTTLGLRGTQGFEAGGMAGTVRATLGWRHAFGDLSPSSRLAFEGSQTFTVTGAPIARNAALLELGADLAVGRNTTLGVSYAGQVSKDSREHGAQVNLRWRF